MLFMKRDISLKNIKNRINRHLYRFSTSHVPNISWNTPLLKSEGYYSQWGQDKFIVEQLLHRKQEGTFVEIGANDGVTFSNTYYFEKNLDWNGIAIEPLPNTYKKLRNNRKCITVNACVSDVNGTVPFLELDGYTEMFSGIVNKLDARHLARVETTQNKHGGSKNIIDVPSLPLNNLLKNHSFSNIDYLSIDTEGGEFDILKSINFDDINIDIISVENTYSRRYFQKFLRKCGFKLVAIVGDEIYQKQN